tara:strand:- start:3246 stop:4484 length:1239 start_codon:yes stop_codon:yes gene_type:complete
MDLTEMNQLSITRIKNLKPWLLPLSLGLLLFVLAACGGNAAPTQEASVASTAHTAANEEPQTAVLPSAEELVAAQETVFGRIYQKALPSVVNIQVIQGLEGNEGSLLIPDDFGQRGEGSGFVWDDNGRIVTNQHVVEGAETVTVIFADRRQVLAKVLGGDPDSDLAVIELEEPLDDLTVLDRGDSSEVFVGQVAVAIGAPFGQEFTMTSGIVSAVGRTIRTEGSQFTVPEVIQTDAPINPGNSGGPLLDRHGRVVGINTQILTRSGSNAGVGLAVPINIANMVIPSLIESGKYEYSWLGISGAALGPDTAQLMELPKGIQGALVISVNNNSPAHEGGLTGSDRTEVVNGIQYALGGDTITGINGVPIRDMTDLIVYLTNNTRPGDEVMLEVVHEDGESEELPVTLGTRPNRG